MVMFLSNAKLLVYSQGLSYEILDRLVFCHLNPPAFDWQLEIFSPQALYLQRYLPIYFGNDATKSGSEALVMQ